MQFPENHYRAIDRNEEDRTGHPDNYLSKEDWIKKKPFIVRVDDVKVFSADFVFEQMGAQSCRIDRAISCAVVAAIVAAASLALNLVVLLLR